MNKPQRLLSLDVFRGITIAGMILVNNPGDWEFVYPALEHARWHGVTPTDLIFPFFLFIMGTAIPFAFSKRLEEGNQKSLIPKIIRRTLILFLLGLFLNSFPFTNLVNIRILGVLQRIAIVYFFCSLIFLFTKTKTQGIIAAVILLGYWGLLTLIPVPGIGSASLEQKTNLSTWLDRAILGNHIWQYSKFWDPEGILSTLPAIVSGIFGMLVGKWLRSEVDENIKIIRMFVWGSFAIIIAVFWDMFFPLNKNLWTSSFVIYTTGMALFFLSICYWLIDIQKITWWTKPFIILGMNAITVYFLSDIAAVLLGYISVSLTAAGQPVSLRYSIFLSLSSVFSNMNASLIFAILFVVLWIGIMWIFYVRKIFIKV